MMLSKNSVVSSFIACRRLSSKSGNASRSGAELLRLRRYSHCSAKLVDQRLGSRIGQHSLDLLLQHDGIFQLALAGERQQLLVGNAAPQEERQPRSQREIVQPIRRVRRKVRRIGFEAEQELRARQNELQRRFDSAIEGVAAGHARAASSIEVHQRVDACSCPRGGGTPPAPSDDRILSGAGAVRPRQSPACR